MLDHLPSIRSSTKKSVENEPSPNRPRWLIGLIGLLMGTVLLLVFWSYQTQSLAAALAFMRWCG